MTLLFLKADQMLAWLRPIKRLSQDFKITSKKHGLDETLTNQSKSCFCLVTIEMF